MKTLPAGLGDHLNSCATTLCWCWHIVKHDMDELGFTDHDRDIVFDGLTYEASSGFSGSAIETDTGFAVDNLEATGALRSDHLSETALRAGEFDDAEVEVWRVNWSEPDQRVLMRKGTLGEVTHGESGFSAEIRGLVHRLGYTKGRVFQFGCDANLGDGRCTVDLETPANKASAAVASVKDNRVLTVSGLPGYPANWFALGKLNWITGANAGRAGEIKSHQIIADTNLIELWEPTADAVTTGDTLDVYAGCDKQFSTCRLKFQNVPNFRGFPHMPGNDFIAAYPNSDDAGNNGSSRQS